jgi:hypothetical protein
MSVRTEMKFYNSYQEFIKDNIRSCDTIFGTSCIVGATEDDIAEYFKERFFNFYFDHEFYYNYSQTDDIQKEYFNLFNTYFDKVKSVPAIFKELWSKDVRIDTHRYTGGFTFRSKVYSDDGKYIDIDIIEPNEFFFNEYAKEFSFGLKKAYIHYKNEYEGKEFIFI